jgi:general secretion pathway protein I
MKRGFTLLEVMISLAILAISLVALSGLNGGAVAMHAYGRRATEATLLLRGKMLDVEEDLQKNGFSDFNDEKHGDFTEDGSPGYAWSAEILKPDVQLDPAQLMSAIGAGGQGQAGQAKGGGIGGAATALAGSLLGAPGAPQPTTAGGGGLAGLLAGPLGSVLQTQAQTFIETLKKSVREIRLTVSWPEGKQRRTVSASQIVVILPEAVGQTPAVPQPGQPAIPGLPGVPGVPGQPGFQQRPGTSP